MLRHSFDRSFKRKQSTLCGGCVMSSSIGYEQNHNNVGVRWGVFASLVVINVLYVVYHVTREATTRTEQAPNSTASSYTEGWFRRLRKKLFGEGQDSSVLSSWVELIGNTPMVRINCLSQATGCEIYVRRPSSMSLPPCAHSE